MKAMKTQEAQAALPQGIHSGGSNMLSLVGHDAALTYSRNFQQSYKKSVNMCPINDTKQQATKQSL